MLRRKKSTSTTHQGGSSSPTSPYYDDSGGGGFPSDRLGMESPSRNAATTTRVGPGHQLPLPSSVQRTQSKDEMSVVSDLTGLSDLNTTHANNTNPNHASMGPVHATSLLSSQLDPNQVLSMLSSFGGLQASTSFDTGFDTALPILPEETPSVLMKASGSASASFASSHNVNNSVTGGGGDAKKKNPSDDDDDHEAEEEGEEAGPPAWIDFLNDPRGEMTLARRLALALMGYQWYYKPKVVEEAEGEEGDGSDKRKGGSEEAAGASGFFGARGNVGGSVGHLSPAASEAYPFSHSRRETPSLEKAWAYFEHVALPRHLVEPKGAERKNIVVRCFRKLFCKGGKELTRAEPGERKLPTKLYEPVFTPHKQLGDFGLGIGLYFSTLRAMMVITVLAGLVNIPNFIYFSSPEYSNSQPGVATLLQGSAICTETLWVPCPGCQAFVSEPEGNSNLPRSRIGYVNDTGVAGTLWFALRNDCNGATVQQGMVNYATLWFICAGVLGLNLYLRYMEVKMDEDEQTAQDYSIVVENPPGDATDPSEWKRFFDGTFGTHVTACTVAVNNDLLVQSLVERREVLRKIEMMVEPGTAMDRLTLAGIAAKEEFDRRFVQNLVAKLVPGLPELFARLVVLTAKVQGLAQQSYPATNIFVTFETEADQRRVLHALQCNSLMDRMRNNTKAAKDPRHLFRGTRLLSVAEAEEPSTIRWQDLNETLKERIKQQTITLIATLCAIVLIAFIVFVCNTKYILFSSFVIAIFNAIFPMFAKWLNSFESHASAGGVQRSLYCKIALFRWVNTAIVITIITPFTYALTAGGGLISQIYALFFADILTTNAIQLLDPVGHLKRHVLAPRAHTQDAMNLQFQGAQFELAERYTNMTKILFLALWYCAIYPGALFMCAFALLINYFVDRFSLMRTWKRQPHLGTKISEVSRRYFFAAAIVAMAILSSYYWSAFPFDNLCLTNSTVNEAYVGSWQVTQFDTPTKTNTSSGENNTYVGATDSNYQFCLQDFFRFPRDEYRFPFIPEFQPEGLEWMTSEQESVTRIYGWSALILTFLVVLVFLIMIARAVLGAFFKDHYNATGDDQGVNFSEVPSISSYVPQVESRVYSYPLLACNVDAIDHELLEWTDPDRPYSFYDLTKDAEVLTRGMDVSHKVVFSQIAHWAPPKADRPDQ